MPVLVILLGGYTQFSAYANQGISSYKNPTSTDGKVHAYFNPAQTQEGLNGLSRIYLMENEVEEDEVDFSRKYQDLGNHLLTFFSFNTDEHCFLSAVCTGDNYQHYALSSVTHPAYYILFRIFRI